jgi:hypothetical protein
MARTYSRIETADGSVKIREHRDDKYHDRWVTDQYAGYQEALAEDGTPRITDVHYVAPVIEERQQSKYEAQYQQISVQLGFTEKPGIEELLSRAMELVQGGSIEMNDLIFMKWQIDGINTALQIRQGLLWEDWLWV